MLALARETNLQETTFVFPRDAATERREGVKVRIFSLAGEMPFAGHPTLGTSNVFRDDARGAFGEMTQLDPVFGKTHDRTRVAEVIGLRPDDLDPELPIQAVSTGLAFVVVPIRTLRALQSLHLDFDRNDAYFAGCGCRG
jgi:trans-2,3-dihydro-3-hydroxyanthranilate isomerase